jgi:ribA/ribD-fused uncharacterized protein
MMLEPPKEEPLYLARSDPWNPLASYSKHDFELDGGVWPSVEHYYQAMKFEQPELRERIRAAPHPRDAAAIAKKHRRSQRRDWKQLRRVIMTRAVYLKCRTHPEVAQQLLQTGQRRLVENSQYDYYWGCGRDGRGFNTFGEVLMDVRDKLRKTAVSG